MYSHTIKLPILEFCQILILFFRLREKQIIVAVEGKNRNVVYIIPPMCFSKQNANDFIEALDEVIDEMGPEELEVKVTA